ncbi:50S ribosomal protein L24 [[Mycoplasma] testudinis]|uniref:50S ribosomal protein L24 n=1 Tax=[Mycoplasma] testudinis TaxID=33924 RepID=UPI00048005DB|nr:50S ribosomal protein L24 [[Mycoplasma] testudinis]
MQRIKKGDNVTVTQGGNKGSSGIVLKVLLKQQSAIVEGVNKVKKHQKSDEQKNQKSEIVEKEAPIKLANLTLTDPKHKAATIVKVKYTIDPKTNKKIRVNRKSNNQIGGK